MKIVAVLDMNTATSGSLEALSRVRCSIQPKFSVEEVSAAIASGARLDVWPSFGEEDGVVVLDQPESRWLLAGRSVESIECWWKSSTGKQDVSLSEASCFGRYKKGIFL
jgi:hypothetical protein